MSELASVSPARTVAPAHSSAAGQSETGKLEPLPLPLLDALAPKDQLAMMMALVEGMAQTSLDETQGRLELNDEKIAQALDELMEKLEAALEETKKKKDSGGFWGFVTKVVDAVVDFAADVIGAVAGTAADFLVDTVRGPIDLLVSVIKGENFKEALMNELKQLTENGKTAESISQFTEGTMKFATDALMFTGSLVAGLEAGLRGENVLEAMGGQVEELYDSFKDNIANNPGFWDVAGVVMKAAAVAGAVASGGALGIVAVGLMALSEANKEFGIVQKLIPNEEAALLVSLGLEVGGMVCGGLAGGGPDALKVLQQVGGVVMGTAGVVKGVEIIREGDRKADALEFQADLQEIRNRLQRLQRLTELLIEETEDKTAAHSEVLETGSELYATAARTEAAVVFRA